MSRWSRVGWVVLKAVALLVILIIIVFLLVTTPVAAEEIGHVLVPDTLDSRLMRQELERLDPGLSVFKYTGNQVQRDPTRDVIVIYMEEAPEEYKAKRALAAALYEKRMVYVFVKDLERYLSINKGDPRFRIALGRILAHELEHVRRQGPGHDAEGYFKACLSRDEMLALGWGR